MRLALDFDGTIADAAAAKVRYARERYGIELTVATSMRPGAVPLLGEHRYERMIGEVYGTALSLGMEPIAGAVETLHRLQQVHEIHVVSARFDHEREYAEQWLARYGIRTASMTATGRASKVGACLFVEAQILLEDSPGELNEFGGRRDLSLALLETPYNRDAPPAGHWHTVSNWRAFERLVEGLETGSGPKRPARRSGHPVPSSPHD